MSGIAESLASSLRPLAGAPALPAFAGGWLADGSSPAPYLDYLAGDDSFNWSEELEDLHENEGADHFLDTWTRQAVLDGLDLGRLTSPGGRRRRLLVGRAAARARARAPRGGAARSGRRAMRASASRTGSSRTCRSLRASALDLPLEDASVDAIASLNVLEHLSDDVGALAEMRRVLRPGGRAAIVVPAGPGLYDFYDRHLQHERRYARGELRRKAEDAGLRVRIDAHLGSALLPAFWVVKKRNRRLQRSLSPERERELVAGQIEGTKDSRVGRALCALERRALARGIRAPFGIRSFAVLERP